jgi:hypothetical protein
VALAAIALVERANLASRNGDPAGARSLSKLALRPPTGQACRG